MTTAVVAIDDHPIVVEGLMALLAREDPTFELIRAASGWPEIQALLDRGEIAPDLALVDLHRNDGTEPAEAVTGLVSHGIPVVILTSELRPVPIRRMVQAGALGLVLKSDPVEQLLTVMRAALTGDFECSSDLAFVLVSDPEAHARLAPREMEALALLAEGWPRKTLGSKMDPPVSLPTVVTYLNRAVQRYRDLGRGVETSADAVRAATADGWLDIPTVPAVSQKGD
ncbi:MAG TPA: response regulator transcription factor [Phycicoccus sp.]|nr:response regulator transcription factor [Phycicoccus sp.]